MPHTHTQPLPRLPEGASRLQLRFARDFGSEDLLLIQAALLEQLSSSLGIAAERVRLVTSYGAGQYVCYDLLPTSDGASADELASKLVSLAEDAQSPLHAAEPLALLNELRSLGATPEADALLVGAERLSGRAFKQTDILEVIKLIAFSGALLLATGILCGICYGTMKGGAEAHAKIESLVPSGKQYGKKKKDATDEERQILSPHAYAGDGDGGDDAEDAERPRGARARGGNGVVSPEQQAHARIGKLLAAIEMNDDDDDASDAILPYEARPPSRLPPARSALHSDFD